MWFLSITSALHPFPLSQSIRWTWLLLGIVLLLILLVVVRAYCSWKSQPQEKRVRRSCSREVKRDGRLQGRTKEEEEEVNNCYVPPPPSTPPLGPKMSWQGSPLPTCSQDYDLPGQSRKVLTNPSAVDGFLPASPNGFLPSLAHDGDHHNPHFHEPHHHHEYPHHPHPYHPNNPHPHDHPAQGGASDQPSRISTDLSRQGAASRSSIYV